MQKENDRKRKRIRLLKTLAGLLATVLLAAAAFCVPGVVYSINDKNTFARQESIHMELTRYEKKSSLTEQLFSFALCQRNHGMRAVPMEDNNSISNEELTQIIQTELQRLTECGVLHAAQSINAQELVSRRLYIAYINSWNGQRDGITFWQAEYQNTQEEAAYKLEVILDMEYHRIYGLWIENEEIRSMCGEYGEILDKMNSRQSAKMREEEQSVFLDSMQEYYKISEEEYMTYSDTGGVESFYDSDAAASISGYNENTTKKEDIRAKEQQMLYCLPGSLVFLKKEGETDDDGWVEEYRLRFIKEYDMQDTGACSLYIGIGQLKEILQL